MEELASIYASADVFVNPTLEDTFPTTNLEALACGTPVITFDTGGSPESITSETGFVVPQGDTQQLKSAVHHISKVGKSQFTQQCFEHAKLNFNKNDKYLEYLNLYRKVCA
jgi:glycosyltransferase involved in cell wall biosynthesis